MSMEQAYRIFVEKKPGFRVEAEGLCRDLNESLGLQLHDVRLVNVYDLFGFTPELVERSKYRVFGEVVTDTVTDGCDFPNSYLAIEPVPGQFDQRAASAVDCVRLLEPAAKVEIKSGKLLIFSEKLSDATLAKIRKYCINPVESREKDLTKLGETEQPPVMPVPVLTGFRDINDAEAYCKEHGLAMNGDDLRTVIAYFQREGRDPRETELRILDTYWSDHCRHTTFMTELTDIAIEDSFLKAELEAGLHRYLELRRELGREDKPICLMDVATIGAKYLRKEGRLDDLEVSDENNACSIYVDVDIDGRTEKWLLQFKNETHNHPTEIEPFGGASTCVGGAIRDPLSGRAYVYQAMRVTGAGDIYQPVGETLPGKLPQRIISTQAAAGYSSYGNQIGIATTHVREIYHPNYVAKRLEVGAVVGAVRASNVRREAPAAGDAVLLLGGRTGRDGVGGATGSSKQHDDKSLEMCGSEVQKGNAPEERKLERLMRRAEVTRLIKKSNDFGAGGVSVAIGELADGLEIYLDRVPVKYSGLNATELAISESQERLAVVVESGDVSEFERYCREENVEVTHVADVTDTNRMRMHFRGDVVVDLSREFIDSAGAKHYADAKIGSISETDSFSRSISGADICEKVINNLQDCNVLSQKGLIEMFDATVGRSTVLMPFGGRTQRTETQVSVQKLPVAGYTDTASMMAFGYDPVVSTWSPYHGAAYAVVDAAAKIVAAGGQYQNLRYSYQEYFERMSSSQSWGKPLAALLGALKMQVAFGWPAIGGKDSMSGTFKDIDVPPMLMAFGVATVDARRVISPEFKAPGHPVYLLRHAPTEERMPSVEKLRSNFDFVQHEIERAAVVSGYAVGVGGVAEAVAKMSFGNEIGVDIHADESTLFDLSYGSIVVEATEELTHENAVLLGYTTEDKSLAVNDVRIPLEELYRANTERFAAIYPDKVASRGARASLAMREQAVPAPHAERPSVARHPRARCETPMVFIPSFPGTNSDYDTAKAFRKAGAEVQAEMFCNLTPDAIGDSIERFKRAIDGCHIFALSGGFSAGDEPDGSGKFIANVLNNSEIAESIHALLERGGLILGICNGFQALVKSGLLPYGRLGMVTEDSPTLFRNDINRHISQIVTTRVASVASPWLSGFTVGDEHAIAVSHGEGKFVVNEALAKELFDKGQVAFQYVGDNPNGSDYDIEGILDASGQILGKMGHTERYEEYLYKNITGNKVQDIFTNAVNYFKR